MLAFLPVFPLLTSKIEHPFACTAMKFGELCRTRLWRMLGRWQTRQEMQKVCSHNVTNHVKISTQWNLAMNLSTSATALSCRALRIRFQDLDCRCFTARQRRSVWICKTMAVNPHKAVHCVNLGAECSAGSQGIDREMASLSRVLTPETGMPKQHQTRLK